MEVGSSGAWGGQLPKMQGPGWDTPSSLMLALPAPSTPRVLRPLREAPAASPAWGQLPPPSLLPACPWRGRGGWADLLSPGFQAGADSAAQEPVLHRDDLESLLNEVAPSTPPPTFSPTAPHSRPQGSRATGRARSPALQGHVLQDGADLSTRRSPEHPRGPELQPHLAARGPRAWTWGLRVGRPQSPSTGAAEA